MVMQFEDVCKAVYIQWYSLYAAVTCFFNQRSSQKYLVLDSSRQEDQWNRCCELSRKSNVSWLPSDPAAADKTILKYF